MNLCDFLHFNDSCPVCGKELSLYMQVSKSALWKAKKTKEGVYQFQQCLLKKDTWEEKDYMSLSDLGDQFKTEFNSSKLGNDSKTWQLFFFKICGTEAFVDNRFDYDINWYEACYYRSSPWFEFKNHPTEKKKWQLEPASEEHYNMVNREECFVFKNTKVEGVEKVYALSLDYEGKHTKLWHYSTTPEQRALAEFEPNIFEKDDLPLLKHRPDLRMETRDKLISRFESWIILS
jgi:hypothetical protein